MLSRSHCKRKEIKPGSGKTHLTGARPSKGPYIYFLWVEFHGFNFSLVRQTTVVLKYRKM